MASSKADAQILAALDQLIIKREVNLSRLQDQLEELNEPTAGRLTVETAILLTRVALERLAKNRADIVMRGL